VLNKIYRHSIDRDLLAQIKDETAWEKAKQLERQEGFEEGVQHGIEQGVQQGEKRKALETARKMLKRGFTPEEVTDLTGLTISELKSLTQED